jgi:hypothetical protein
VWLAGLELVVTLLTLLGQGAEQGVVLGKFSLQILLLQDNFPLFKLQLSAHFLKSTL